MVLTYTYTYTYTGAWSEASELQSFGTSDTSMLILYCQPVRCEPAGILLEKRLHRLTVGTEPTVFCDVSSVEAAFHPPPRAFMSKTLALSLRT